MDAKTKGSLGCRMVLGDKHLYGAMLEDKHCFKVRGVITCTNTSYYGLLGKKKKKGV